MSISWKKSGAPKKRYPKKDRDGLGACLGFLGFMFVMGCLSRVISWQMKPEVTVRDAEYRVLEENIWMRGSVRNGEIITDGENFARGDGAPARGQESVGASARGEDGDGASTREKEEDGDGAPARDAGDMVISVFTQDGEVENWEREAELEDCLIRYTRSLGECLNVVPSACLSGREADRAYVSHVERSKSSTSPYVIASTGMNIQEEAGAWAVLGYSLDDMVIAQSKPIQDGDSVRIKTDEVMTQDGCLEVLPGKKDAFYSPFTPWMLETILPEGCRVKAAEAEGGSMISRLCYTVQAGERMEDAGTELRELLGEAQISENVRIYSFLETQRWLDLACGVRSFFAWAVGVVVIAVWLYRDVRLYGKRLLLRCQGEYPARVLDEEIVTILIRAICYVAGIFTIVFLSRKLGSFNMDLAGRLLPRDRVFDLSHYKTLWTDWKEGEEFYCRLFPQSEGAQYYAALLGEWKKTALIAATTAAGGIAAIAGQRIAIAHFTRKNG